MKEPTVEDWDRISIIAARLTSVHDSSGTFQYEVISFKLDQKLGDGRESGQKGVTITEQKNAL